MLTDLQEASLLDHYHGVSSLVVPDFVHLALHNGGAIDTDDGTGFSEPADANYVRVTVLQSELWDNARVDSDGNVVAMNKITIEWPATDGAVNSITHVVELDDPTSTSLSDIRRIYELSATVNLSAGEVFRLFPCKLKTIFGVPVEDPETELSDVNPEE